MIVAPTAAPTSQPGTSASQVKDFAACERFWHIRSVLGDRRPPTASQAWGTGAHKQLEDVLTVPGHAVDREFSPAVAAVRAARHDARRGGYLVLPDPVADAGIFTCEQVFHLPTYPGGPLWKGLRDLWIPGRAPPEVVDYKTTSDLRYALTEAKLEVDPQSISYAKQAIEETAGVYRDIRVTFVYVTSRGRPRTQVVSVDLDREHVETQWTRLVAKVRRMTSLRQVRDFEDITPTGVDTGHCHSYGGCPYRSKCGIGDVITISTRPKKQETANMSAPTSGETLFERLKRARAGGAAPEPTAPPPAAPAPPAAPSPAPVAVEGVVPPDAPPREQPVETIAPPPPADAPKRRGRPPKIKSAPGADLAALPPEIDRPKPAGKAVVCPACGGWAPLDTKGRFMDHPGVDLDLKPYPEGMGACVTSGDLPDTAFAEVAATKARLASPASGSEQGATGATPYTGGPPPVAKLPAPLSEEIAPGAGGIEAIYVDCLPVKGAHKTRFSMAEDWLAHVAGEAAKANDVADYRLINYTSRGVLATAISASRQLGEVPPVLVVSSHLSGSDVILECLIPFARTVVRGLRG